MPVWALVLQGYKFLLSKVQKREAAFDKTRFINCQWSAHNETSVELSSL